MGTPATWASKGRISAGNCGREATRLGHLPMDGAAMLPRTIRQATQILFDVLERGLSYREAGLRHGIVRSTAEKQVKALVRLAASQTPIGNLRGGDLSSLALLRGSREAVLKALQAFDPAAKGSPSAIRSSDDLAEAVRSLRSQSENANRDVALLMLLFCTGAKPLEVAGLQVRDYLIADGSARESTEIGRRNWWPPSRPATLLREPASLRRLGRVPRGALSAEPGCHRSTRISRPRPGQRAVLDKGRPALRGPGQKRQRSPALLPGSRVDLSLHPGSRPA